MCFMLSCESSWCKMSHFCHFLSFCICNGRKFQSGSLLVWMFQQYFFMEKYPYSNTTTQFLKNSAMDYKQFPRRNYWSLIRCNVAECLICQRTKNLNQKTNSICFFIQTALFEQLFQQRKKIIGKIFDIYEFHI